MSLGGRIPEGTYFFFDWVRAATEARAAWAEVGGGGGLDDGGGGGGRDEGGGGGVAFLLLLLLFLLLLLLLVLVLLLFLDILGDDVEEGGGGGIEEGEGVEIGFVLFTFAFVFVLVGVVLLFVFGFGAVEGITGDEGSLLDDGTLDEGGGFGFNFLCLESTKLLQVSFLCSLPCSQIFSSSSRALRCS